METPRFFRSIDSKIWYNTLSKKNQSIIDTRIDAFVVNRPIEEGFYSIRINDQWRIIFQWTSQGPAEVDIVDYH